MSEALANTAAEPQPPAYYCPGCGARFFGPGVCTNGHPQMELAHDPTITGDPESPAIRPSPDEAAAPSPGDETAPPPEPPMTAEPAVEAEPAPEPTATDEPVAAQAEEATPTEYPKQSVVNELRTLAARVGDLLAQL